MNQDSEVESSPQAHPKEGEEEHGLVTGPGKGFQFLNFSNYNDTKARETKSRVRSHVMHGVHQIKSGGKRNKPSGSVDLDTSSLLKSQAAQLSVPPPPDVSMSGPDRLGSARNDPFQQYPIEMNQRTLELYDHLRGDFCPMFKTMSKIGFFRSITDPAGFLQILCTSVSHQTALRQQRADRVHENPEAIRLSIQAIQSVNRRLGDPFQSTSEGVVAAILAFCSHTIMFNDVAGSQTHLIGLEEIIRRRGGVEMLDLTPAMRIVLFWVDTNFAFMTDSTPRFPFPNHLIPTALTPSAEKSLPLVEACTAEDLTPALQDLYNLNWLIVNESAIRNIWADGVFAWMHIVPVLHKLLLKRYGDPRLSTLRAGAMLYIAAIRRRFGVRFLTHIQIRNLKNSMIQLPQDRQPTFETPVWIWLLVLGSTLSFLKDDHERFVSQTAQRIVSMGYWSLDEVMGYVKQVSWIDGILLPELEELRFELSTAIENLCRMDIS